MNPQEFASKIRAKYPGAYDSIDDVTLSQKMIAKYPVYQSQVKFHTQPEVKGTLLNPLKESVQGLKTLYGGGEQGIANKLKTDIQSGAQDIQNGNVIKGVAKAGLRTAGDVAGAIYAPVGALIGATGINKVFDYLGELSQKGGKYNPINLITDSKLVQDFVTKHPNLEEDFGRILNLALSKGETGKINPSTVIERTVQQFDSAKTRIAEVPGQVKAKVQSAFTKPPEDIIAKRADELAKISGSYAQLRKGENLNPERSVESRKRIASTDVLANSVDNTGTIRTKEPGGAVEQYKEFTLDHAENVVKRNLERLGEKTSLDEVKLRLEEAVNKSGLEGSDLKVALNKVKQEIAGYKLKADAEGNVPLTLIQDAKISTTKGIDFNTPPEIKTYRKSIAEGLKTTIEKNSKFNVKEVNAELAKYLEDIKFLEQLDGKKVKGGKLGKYFAQISGNIVGGAVGSAVGGPIGGAAGTMLGGEIAGRIKGSMLERTLGGKTGNVPLKNPVIQSAIDRAEGNNLTNRINNPQSNNLGKRNQQYQTPTTTKKNVPINQSSKAVSNKAPITKTSSRIIKESIPQKKGFIQKSVDKLKDKYKNSPLSGQGGYIGIGKKPFEATVKKYVTDRVAKGDIQYIVNNMARLKRGGVLPDLADARWEDFIEKLKIDRTASPKKQIEELQKLLNGEMKIPNFLQKL